MTSTVAAPLPVLYLPPPDPGVLADLLVHEVAACVAAVGHRLHVLRSPSGTVRDAVAEFSAGHGREPVLVILGRLDAQPAVPLLSGTATPTTVATVTLDGAGAADAGSSALALPSRSRSLCRLLAHGAGPELPGRALVLVHRGEGPGGDDAWPGLSWGLTLLLGGPGRGVLVDLQGAGGGLHSRLRTVSERLGQECPGPVPTPGPALAARLPAAGGVRWWSMAGRPCDLMPGIGAAIDTFPWSVLDVGRNALLAAELAAEGLPALSATERDGTCHLEPLSGPPPGPGERLAVDASRWCGTSAAAWRRAARRRASIDLAARLTTMLSHDLEGAPR